MIEQVEIGVLAPKAAAGSPAALCFRAPEEVSISRRPRRPWLYPAALLAIDVTAWVGIYLAFSAIFPSNQFGAIDLILPFAVILAILALVGGYNPRSNAASLKYATEHLIACSCAFLAAAFAVYVVATFGGGVSSSRGVLGLSFGTFAVTSLAARRFLWFAVGRYRTARQILVIADSDLNEVFYSAYAASGQGQRLHVVATDQRLVGQFVAGVDGPRYESTLEDLPRLLAGTPDSPAAFESVVVAVGGEQINQDMLGLLATVHFQEMPVYSIRAFYEAYWEKMPAHLLTATWPLQAGFHLVKHSVFASAKRTIDVVVAGIATVLLSPLMLLLMVAVRLDSRGPAFFKQTRVGQHRRPFTLLKFRSMYVGSETKGLYTTDRDPRITRVGRFLRKTRLDELPQLINVLRGEMSIIGPRAEWIKCVEHYEQVIPHYHFRHLVRPGITGWAQVNYPYGTTIEDTVEKLMYDLYYIRNFSLNLDAAVVLKTLHVMSFGKGR